MNDLLIEIDGSEIRSNLLKLKAKKKKFILIIDYKKKSIELLKKRNTLLKEENKRKLKELKLNYSIGSISKNNYLSKKYIINSDNISAEIKLINLKSEENDLIIELEIIKTEINKTNEKLFKYKVFAKIDGIVIEHDDIIKEGMYFSAGDKIQTIFSSKKIFAEIIIPEKKISKIEINQKVILFINALSYTKYKTFQGKLIELESSFIDNRKFFYGKVEILDPYFKIKSSGVLKTKKLLFGMNLKARIFTGKKNMIKKLLNIDE